MKILSLCFLKVLLSFVGYAQQAEIVVFRHDLRWVDETKFPNFFLYDEVRDTIFNATKHELSHYLGLTEIKLPENVSYKIINGFGNQKVKLPKTNPKNDYEVGIYSFITRGTVGYSILWKFNIVIKKAGKEILAKEVVHELEYFNASGYLTTRKWLEPDQFRDIFIRMLQESLGVLPSSNEVIVIGSLDEQERKAQALFRESTRHILKIDGRWRVAGNFAAQLESPVDTVIALRFNEKLSWEFPKPSFSGVLAGLFSQTTGIEVVTENMIDYEKTGRLIFSDGDELGILLKWIEIESSSTFSDEDFSQRILDPLIAEIYSKDKQIGYFVYTQEEIVYSTEKTKKAFNSFNGFQIKNSLGIEQKHRIVGELFESPIFAEYNESLGIIEVISGEDLLGAMVVDNLNPDNRSISDETLSKNKKIVSGVKLSKSSLEKTKTVEWYPIYLPNDYSAESEKMCIETLIFLFFGIGNM
ncbi:hypothetical protein [Aestuariibaculum sediminum]|uniref:Uncharacterized protein n=1 Tax=Aestuariibaculum sediminum TaxID=2770637 RepID=A0A8J6Q8I5_9FLAO|nr:hypothetical protein [Aestuariibaculum sediminum]MBD0831612.1 hypothetical protein [Aestuariibaculum sediminum]